MNYRDILTTRGVSSVFYNKYKWRITFKNCELLCCTPVTHMVWYINYVVDVQLLSHVRLFVDPMDFHMPGLPVTYHLLEFA